MQHKLDPLAPDAPARDAHDTARLCRAESSARAQALARILDITRTHWDAALDARQREAKG